MNHNLTFLAVDLETEVTIRSGDGVMDGTQVEEGSELGNRGTSEKHFPKKLQAFHPYRPLLFYHICIAKSD